MVSYADDTTTAYYRYDARPDLRRRVETDVDGAVTYFAYDGLDSIQEYAGDLAAGNAYVTPSLDDNLALIASGSTYHYLKDALGSIRQLIDSSEDTQNAYDYEAFGSVYGTPTENIPQPYRFTARKWDTDSSLYYYRARMYDAEVGRFGARDPVPPDLPVSPYVYVGNMPADRVDLYGLQSRGRKYEPGTFDVIISPSGNRRGGVEISIAYTPGEDECCDEYRFVQLVKTTIRRKWWFDETTGWHLDRYNECDYRYTPWYLTEHVQAAPVMKVPEHWEMYDNPGDPWLFPQGALQVFETCIVCIEGGDRGTVYGCVKWGYSEGKRRKLSHWGSDTAVKPTPPSAKWERLFGPDWVQWLLIMREVLRPRSCHATR